MTSKHFRIPCLCLKLSRFCSLVLFFSVFCPVSCQLLSSNASVAAASQYRALMAFKRALIDGRGILKSWNGTNACSGSWAGVKCSEGVVTAIQLPWKGLGGHISEELRHLTALQKLSLHHNFIQGPIPSSVGLLRNLRSIVLSNNRLSGSIPLAIGSHPRLRTLDVSSNSLSGTIPAGLSNATRLRRLNLSYNALVGSIPNNLIQSLSLVYVDLHSNNLSGSIPAFFGELGGLEELFLSHNSFIGSIPEELGGLSKLRKLDLSGNRIGGGFPRNLCNISSLSHLNLGKNRIEGPIPEAIDGLHNLSVLVLSQNQLNGPLPSSIGNIDSLTQLDVSENNLVGQIPDQIANLSNLEFFNVSFNNLSGSVPQLLSKNFNSSSFRGNLQLCGYAVSVPCTSSPSPPPLSNPHGPPPPSDEIRTRQESHHRRRLSGKDIILIVAGAAIALSLVSCSVLLCCLIRRRTCSSPKGLAGDAKKADPAIGTEVESGGQAAGKLVHFDGPMVFTADDLLCATAEIMGKSAYGTVYKATLEDGSEVAVKRLREKVVKNRRAFEAAAEALAKIRHPNLVPLRSYYVGPKGEKLLVFDFMPKGSLASFLHARGPHTSVDWPTRMNIAIGVSRGLCHLHTQQSMVHGNLTSGNILLDEHANPKITDFGLSHLVSSSGNLGTIGTAGTVGYRAPELSKAKDATMKSDVYSLGVIILELLTGKLPNEDLNGVDLPHWVASVVNEEWTNEVFDVELTKDASPTAGDELLNTLKLALHCVDPSPGARPDVQHILRQLEEIKPDLAAAGHSEEEEATGVPPTSQ